MGNQYYRTFIAVPVKLDNPLLEARKDLEALLAHERISWVKPSGYHVTLRFLGDSPAGETGNISRVLERRVMVPEKKLVGLTGLGYFGSRNRPKVIWTGFAPGIMLESLRAEVDAALADCGILGEEDPFRAHLTLGRIRSLADRENFFRVLKEMDDRFRGRILFDKLVFYRSEPGRGGPVYTPLHILEFRG